VAWCHRINNNKGKKVPKACDLKRGMIVEINEIQHAVKLVEAKSPSSRGASTMYKVRFTNLQNGQKLDQSYKGDDLLREIDCARVQVQYSYLDGDTFYFMDQEDYSQHGLNRQDLAGQADYLVEGMEGITALLVDGLIMGIELPQSVTLTVTDTSPGVKGATATGRTKPATLVTGLEIQVPEYLEPGEQVKVNTTTGKFMSRA